MPLRPLVRSCAPSLVALALCSCASTPRSTECGPAPPIPMPADLEEAVQRGGFDAALPLVWTRLDENVGNEFPDFELVRSDGSATRARELARGPAAFVLLPPNAELTARWRATFERHGWKMPSGREVFIIAFEDQLAAGVGLSLGRRLTVEHSAVSLVPNLQPTLLFTSVAVDDVGFGLGLGLDLRLSTAFEVRVSGSFGTEAAPAGVAVTAAWLK